MQPFHLTLSTRGRVTLFPEAADLTRAAVTLARVAGERLLLFCIVDDHAHIVINATSASAGDAAGGILRAFRWLDAPPCQPAFIEPVDGRKHLVSLVSYLTRQPEKHGLAQPSAVWPGSCAPDVLGVRRLAGFDPERIERALPRLGVRSAVASAANVWTGALRPATDAELASLPPAALWEGTLAATGAPATGRSAATLAARAAFAALAADRAALGLRPRAARRIDADGADPLLLDAIRRRVALTAWLATLPQRRPQATFTAP